jgi:hypothetical protein
MDEQAKVLKQWVASGRTVWTGGQAWAVCDTPGQAARVAEDMNAVVDLRERVSKLEAMLREAVGTKGYTGLYALGVDVGSADHYAKGAPDTHAKGIIERATKLLETG